VYERDELTSVAAVDPERMLSIVKNEQLAPIAALVRDKLATVVARATAQYGET
jgi:hypothetical protein